MSNSISGNMHINQLLSHTGLKRPGQGDVPSQAQMSDRLERLENRSEVIPEKLAQLSEETAKYFANMEQRALDNGNEDLATAITERAARIDQRIDNLSNRVSDRLNGYADRIQQQLEAKYDSAVEPTGDAPSLDLEA